MNQPLLNSHQQTTFFVTLSWGIALAVYDGLVKYYWGGEATISWTLAILSRRYPFFPLMMGLLVGHLFLVRWVPNLWSWHNLGSLAFILVGLILGATATAQQPPEEGTEEETP